VEAFRAPLVDPPLPAGRAPERERPAAASAEVAEEPAEPLAPEAPPPAAAAEPLRPAAAADEESGEPPEGPEPPSLPEPASGTGPEIDPAEIARGLAPAGPLEVETRSLMGIALHTARSPRLAGDAVVGLAFRFLSFLAESPGAQAVTQTTIRGGAGAMVLTPLGPLAGGGPVLAVAVPHRGGLALLEILSLRIAADYRAARAGLGSAVAAGGPGVAAPPPLGEEPVPPRVEALARSITVGGPLRPLCVADSAGRLVLYLLVGPEVDPQWIGRLACDLYRVMGVEDAPGGVGPIQSVVVRLGSQRVVVSAVAENPERSTLLVAAGPADPRPGLGRLQLERLAARLAGASA
jgi:hypothetical protein